MAKARGKTETSAGAGKKSNGVKSRGTSSPAAQAAELAALVEESVLEVRGTVIANRQAPGGAELVDPEIEVLVAPDLSPPFDLYRPQITAALPTQLDHAAVALRHPNRQAVQRLAAAAVAGFRSTLDARSKESSG